MSDRVSVSKFTSRNIIGVLVLLTLLVFVFATVREGNAERQAELDYINSKIGCSPTAGECD